MGAAALGQVACGSTGPRVGQAAAHAGTGADPAGGGEPIGDPCSAWASDSDDPRQGQATTECRVFRAPRFAAGAWLSVVTIASGSREGDIAGVEYRMVAARDGRWWSVGLLGASTRFVGLDGRARADVNLGDLLVLGPGSVAVETRTAWGYDSDCGRTTRTVRTLAVVADPARERGSSSALVPLGRTEDCGGFQPVGAGCDIPCPFAEEEPPYQLEFAIDGPAITLTPRSGQVPARIEAMLGRHTAHELIDLAAVR